MKNLFRIKYRIKKNEKAFYGTEQNFGYEYRFSVFYREWWVWPTWYYLGSLRTLDEAKQLIEEHKAEPIEPKFKGPTIVYEE